MTEYCICKSYNFTGDPFDIFYLFKDEPFVFFLDSGLHNTIRGRYSFIGFDPFVTFSDKGRNSLNDLRKMYNSYIPSISKTPSPFPAGMMGFFGYDFGLQLEKIQLRAQDDLLLPDCLFGFYDCIITIDHLTHKLYVTSSGLPEKKSYLIKERANSRASYIIKRLSSYKTQEFLQDNTCILNGGDLEGDLLSNFTKADYLKAIDKALRYIEQGEIYQVNLSQRFSLDISERFNHFDLIDVYRLLRRISPSNFGGYFNCGGFQLISNSPEEFLRLRDNVVLTRPMKGTRPRGQNELGDKKLKKELINSRKDRAELLMITDLLRNDLGRVCKYGTIQVKEMRTLEEYATVFQTTSTVEGVLNSDKDTFDLITASYPGGSITGCPKIRAMEIIEELEPIRRSIYTGSMGYFSFTGAMDFNILIRTLLATQERIYFQVGGGIVADSIPEKEYNETLIKARALQYSLAGIKEKADKRLKVGI